MKIHTAALILLFSLFGVTFGTQFKVTIGNAPLKVVEDKAREGKVSLEVLDMDGQVFKVGGSQDDEKFTLVSRHTYNFEVPIQIDDVAGIKVTWNPKDAASKDRLYPLGFRLQTSDGEKSLRLCRRKASDGIIPGGSYTFKRFPACMRDWDQTPPKDTL